MERKINFTELQVSPCRKPCHFPVRGKNKSEDKSRIKVYVRAKPMPKKPAGVKKDNSVLKSIDKDNGMITYASSKAVKAFNFDFVGNGDTNQEEIFRQIGKPIAESCISGYNATIFAYGQTGSGKTHTMTGPPMENGEFDTESDQRGMIPRILTYLFQIMEEYTRQTEFKAEFTVKASYIEIYNEKIGDLLNPESDLPHNIREASKNVFVENITEIEVANTQEALDLLCVGNESRHIGETLMNSKSSRSHAMLLLTIDSEEERDGIVTIKQSKLSLVDLAGSERQKDSKAEGTRLKEAASINKSLLSLRRVIMGLVDLSNGKSRFIHHRDSKLTYLLKDSLGGNAITCIVCTVSPTQSCASETLSTLQFATFANTVKNKAIVNATMSSEERNFNNKLQARVRELESELETAEEDFEIKYNLRLKAVTKEKDDAIRAIQAVLDQQKSDHEAEVGALAASYKSQLNTLRKTHKREMNARQATIDELSSQMEQMKQEFEAKKLELASEYQTKFEEGVAALKGELTETKRLLGAEREAVQKLEKEKHDLDISYKIIAKAHSESSVKATKMAGELNQVIDVSKRVKTEKEGLKRKFDELSNDHAKVTTELSSLVGHNNPRQKIKIYDRIKTENNKMKKEIEALKESLSRKDIEIESLKKFKASSNADGVIMHHTVENVRSGNSGCKIKKTADMKSENIIHIHGKKRATTHANKDKENVRSIVANRASGNDRRYDLRHK